MSQSWDYVYGLMTLVCLSPCTQVAINTGWEDISMSIYLYLWVRNYGMRAMLDYSDVHCAHLPPFVQVNFNYLKQY